MHTVQEKNSWLFVVKQVGPAQFEWYKTIYKARAYEQAFGNHVGEEVVESGTINRWQSLDGHRKYQLGSSEPDWVEGVEVKTDNLSTLNQAITEQITAEEVSIPNKEVEGMDLLKIEVRTDLTPDEVKINLNPEKPNRKPRKPKG